jgi:hypothetical protein
VLLKAIFMLYRLPESERVCSGICKQMSHNLRNLIFQTYKITNLKGIIGVHIIL